MVYKLVETIEEISGRSGTTILSDGTGTVQLGLGRSLMIFGTILESRYESFSIDLFGSRSMLQPNELSSSYLFRPLFVRVVRKIFFGLLSGGALPMIMHYAICSSDP